MLRYLRIATLTLCLGVCVLLTVLWIRSYYREDGLCWGFTDTTGVMAFSADGKLMVNYTRLANGGAIASSSSIPAKRRPKRVVLSKWFVASYPPGESFWLNRETLDSAVWGFRLRPYRDAVIPHWFALLTLGAMAATLYFKRFSLRTVLIAMTLVALVFGIMAISNKRTTRGAFIPFDQKEGDEGQSIHAL